MNLEQRLQHASRDLREVRIVVPPLGRGATAHQRQRSMAAPLLVPLLFVAGGLFAIGAARTGDQRSVQSDLSAAGSAVDPPAAPAPVQRFDRPEPPIVARPAPVEPIPEFVTTVPTTATPPTQTRAGKGVDRLASGVGPV